MPGYLEEYGAGDEKRERRTKLLVLAAAAALVAGAAGYFTLRDWREERQADRFLALLQQSQYQAAHALWGCAKPSDPACKDYPFEKFMEDWGPKGAYSGAASGKRTAGERCGTGYIATIAYAGGPVSLWVEHKNQVISFAPWAECPEMRFRLVKWLKMKFGGG